MIDNIIMILELTLTQPSLNYKELFQTILVEIPVGKYFCRYLDDQTENHMLHVSSI